MLEERVTEQAAPAAAKRKRRRGRVTVYSTWCKGCGLCVAFCPMKVLEQAEDGKVTVAQPDQCTACHWCEQHCPDFAIFVTDVTDEEGK